MKKRKLLPLRPAEPQSTREPLRGMESDARKLYFIKKVFLRDGGDAVVNTVSELVRGGPDPSEASMMAHASVTSLSAVLDAFDGSQRGRSEGGASRGRQRALESALDYDDIRGRATKLLVSHDAREISGIICQQTGFSRPKVLRALKSHPSGRWKKGNAS